MDACGIFFFLFDFPILTIIVLSIEEILKISTLFASGETSTKNNGMGRSFLSKGASIRDHGQTEDEYLHRINSYRL